jgi:hypothetical protein
MIARRPVMASWAGLAMLLALCACGAPQPVLDLSGRTAANTALVGRQLSALAQDSRRIAELRAANVAALNSEARAVRQRHEFDLVLTQRSGEQQDLNRLEALRRWAETVRTMFAVDAEAEAKDRAEILRGRTEIDARSAELGQVAEILAALAKHEPADEHAAFLAKFVLDVAQDVDKKLDTAEKAKTKAEEEAGAAKAAVKVEKPAQD